ncbi:hypothetical protein An02g14700 [Aspergillus niger]|uniref:Uncharacterized protein n=2 Tax=Aspergillus niger TaxID=5061 RepID=A2QFI8_ASPNC|nr:hypothetical protein An02g14700 [Aspergillus niger]CAK48899.1 hypothetical protein An02g14700 [Aspergillus niger]
MKAFNLLIPIPSYDHSNYKTQLDGLRSSVYLGRSGFYYGNPAATLPGAQDSAGGNANLDYMQHTDSWFFLFDSKPSSEETPDFDRR